MFTDVVGCGKEKQELTDSVTNGKYEFLLMLLQNSLLQKPLEPVCIADVKRRYRILEVLSDGSLLLLSYDAPAKYWLMFPDAAAGASTYWVQFSCAPPDEGDDYILQIKGAQQRAAALTHLRGQQLRDVNSLAANR